jgi:hypothetical protein
MTDKNWNTGFFVNPFHASFSMDMFSKKIFRAEISPPGMKQIFYPLKRRQLLSVILSVFLKDMFSLLTQCRDFLRILKNFW